MEGAAVVGARGGLGALLNVTGAWRPTNGLSGSSTGRARQLGTGLGDVDGGGVGRPFGPLVLPDLGEVDGERDETAGEIGRGWAMGEEGCL